MNTEDSERDWYKEGRLDGLIAVRVRGGTKGAKWHAESLQLEGVDKEDYIAGFNDALDEMREY